MLLESVIISVITWWGKHNHYKRITGSLNSNKFCFRRCTFILLKQMLKNTDTERAFTLHTENHLLYLHINLYCGPAWWFFTACHLFLFSLLFPLFSTCVVNKQRQQHWLFVHFSSLSVRFSYSLYFILFYPQTLFSFLFASNILSLSLLLLKLITRTMSHFSLTFNRGLLTKHNLNAV